MMGSDFLLALAAHLAWMEGKDHGPNGPIAILFCIRNQVAAGFQDGNLGQILQAAYYKRHLQDIKLSYIPASIDIPDVRNPETQKLLSYIEGIFDNSIQDRLTEGATHWGNDCHIGFRKVAQVGTLNLWR